MKTIDLLSKVVRYVLREPSTDRVQAINTGDFCLDDIIGKDGEHLPSFLYQANQLSKLKGRTVKNVEWRTIDDKDCAVYCTIGFFRIELEP